MGLLRRWGALQMVHGESTSAKHVVIGNPAPVAVDTQPGKVVLVFCRNNFDVGVVTSLDWGVTWNTPRYILSANPKHGTNGSWPWLATGPPQGLQLPSGRLLVGSDHRGFPSSNHGLVFSHSMFSDDFGVTWQLSNSIAGGNECQVAALPNGTAGHAAGTVVIHMRDPRGQRLVAWSVDGGARWGPSRPVVVGGRARYGGATCEGSTIAAGKLLLFSTPFHPTEYVHMTL